MVKSLKPLWDYVVFKMMVPDKTQSGLYIPENSTAQRQLVVIAVGPDVKQVKPGDSVVISGDAITGGTFITGERLELCREKDLAAILLTEEVTPLEVVEF